MQGLEFLGAVAAILIEGPHRRPDEGHGGQRDRQADGQQRQEQLTPRLESQSEGGG
jgi:hypothetical protein